MAASEALEHLVAFNRALSMCGKSGDMTRAEGQRNAMATVESTLKTCRDYVLIMYGMATESNPVDIFNHEIEVANAASRN